VKKVRSALSAVDGVTVKTVAMPNVAKITIDEEKVKIDAVLAALKKAGYPATEAKAKKKKV
jgi:copper chaperone CopZ